VLAGVVIVHLSSATRRRLRRRRRRPRDVTVRGAAFLGIGAMVGAGIFALLGEAAVVAGSAVWIAALAVVLDLVWKRVRQPPVTHGASAAPEGL
jgi:hypothetical protein